MKEDQNKDKPRPISMRLLLNSDFSIEESALFTQKMLLMMQNFLQKNMTYIIPLEVIGYIVSLYYNILIKDEETIVFTESVKDIQIDRNGRSINDPSFTVSRYSDCGLKRLKKDDFTLNYLLPEIYIRFKNINELPPKVRNFVYLEVSVLLKRVVQALRTDKNKCKDVTPKLMVELLNSLFFKSYIFHRSLDQDDHQNHINFHRAIKKKILQLAMIDDCATLEKSSDFNLYKIIGSYLGICFVESRVCTKNDILKFLFIVFNDVGMPQLLHALILKNISLWVESYSAKREVLLERLENVKKLKESYNSTTYKYLLKENLRFLEGEEESLIDLVLDQQFGMLCLCFGDINHYQIEKVIYCARDRNTYTQKFFDEGEGKTLSYGFSNRFFFFAESADQIFLDKEKSLNTMLAALAASIISHYNRALLLPRIDLSNAGIQIVFDELDMLTLWELKTFSSSMKVLRKENGSCVIKMSNHNEIKDFISYFKSDPKTLYDLAGLNLEALCQESNSPSKDKENCIIC